MPQGTFGGYKESGHGRILDRRAIEQYLETKTVIALLGTVRPERHLQMDRHMGSITYASYFV